MNLKFLIYIYSFLLVIFSATIFSFVDHKNIIKSTSIEDLDLILGPRANVKATWIGKHSVPKNLSILILAGHADSQGIPGSGTLGEAVALKGLKPMENGISDELYWNLKVLDAVVSIGKKRGLKITSYVPTLRTIEDPNHPISNWSVGANHALEGGYSLEIHFDAYGDYGFGSGLIPPISTNINTIDESLAKSFGRFPRYFRGGLGAPRRQIRVLEIGKLEGDLERNLRDLNSRDKTVQLIASRIIKAIILGINKSERFSPLHDRDDIFVPAIYL